MSEPKPCRAGGAPIGGPPFSAQEISSTRPSAAKHGALFVPGGRVQVAWAKEPATGPGGRGDGGAPVPGPPVLHGFGSRLLDHGLPHRLGG